MGGRRRGWCRGRRGSAAGGEPATRRRRPATCPLDDRAGRGRAPRPPPAVRGCAARCRRIGSRAGRAAAWSRGAVSGGPSGGSSASGPGGVSSRISSVAALEHGPGVEDVVEAEQAEQFLGPGGAGAGDPQVDDEGRTSRSVRGAGCVAGRYEYGPGDGSTPRPRSEGGQVQPAGTGGCSAASGVGCSCPPRPCSAEQLGRRSAAATRSAGSGRRYTTRRGTAVAFIGTTGARGEGQPAGAWRR